ncbi:MAG TPA: YbhB/YbcL family Raf kinase inhibitor-like protein [Streptosporangiaceae bacterium]|nr:YbhB/YbcL family Raf kinase inhibitor-like protein [Streptosporangiaceae bacterium]
MIATIGVAARTGRRARRAACAVAMAALLPLLGGCGLLGGLSASGLSTPASLAVMSPDFSADRALPPQYTCHGAGLSPPLLWSGGLARKPKSYAIVVDDGQAPITPYIYWIVFGISPDTTAIAQNQLPTGAREALNSKGTARYDPPCPVGNQPHTYRFTVYALNASLSNLRNGAGLRQTWAMIASHVIAVGRLTVRAKQ